MYHGVSLEYRKIWDACVSFWLSVVLTSTGIARDLALGQVDQLELQGQFKEAAAILTDALREPALAPAKRKTLAFELDRLERIKKDFQLTREQFYAALQTAVKDLTAQEFDRWIAEGRFDSRVIDGTRYFMGSSVSNLFFRYPELRARRLPRKNASFLEPLLLGAVPESALRHWQTCQAIKHAALSRNKPFILPKRFELTMVVTAAANAVPDGEMIRAWLPIPREYPPQGDFSLVCSAPAAKYVDNPQSSIRSIYLEQSAQKNKTTQFKVRYEYTTHGVWFDVDPARVRACDTNDPTLKPYLAEGPHVVFTPEMRALSARIVGRETNSARKAKSLYDWLGENIKYSFAIEYSTIRNISEYCRSKGYGDCGQQALLYITLCRLNGVPARWQSGWDIFPGEKDIHDWTEIYLEPYGWVPVDPYKSIYATRYATTLTPEQRRQIRDFYFGGLDQYRLIANSDHCQVLSPPKQSMRSDNVDFQRGELEWDTHNIYFDRYSYALSVKELKPPAKRMD